MSRRAHVVVVSLLLLLVSLSAHAAWKMNPFTGKMDYYESGSGDVVGPTSADNNYLAVFNGTTGKALKQFGFYIDNSTGTPTLMGPAYGTTGGDNTHKGNVKNTASPGGALLKAGDYWTLTDETMLLRNQDNSATNILASAYQYRDFAFDNSAMDNMVIIQNLPFTEVWDNVIYTVRGYVDGKPSGAATDNVTTNFYYCASSDNTLAQCTKMFNADPVPTGAATLSPAIDSGTCAAGGEIRISFAAVNLSGKKLNIRARYLRR